MRHAESFLAQATNTFSGELVPLVLLHLQACGMQRIMVLLADRSKLGKVSFARAGRLDQVDVLVTDRGVGREWKKVLKDAGVALVEA